MQFFNDQYSYKENKKGEKNSKYDNLFSKKQ
jgi:hypothetical protein